jgi:hypothetical protein
VVEDSRGRPALAGVPAGFVKHLAFCWRVEILPMNALQQQMSSGVSYYQAEHYDLIGEGRGVLAVSAEIIGVVS